MLENVHTQVLVSASGYFLDLLNRLFGKGLREMCEDDGLADGDEIIDDITNEAAQSQYRSPRQAPDEKTDAYQKMILYVVSHSLQRLKI